MSSARRCSGSCSVCSRDYSRRKRRVRERIPSRDGDRHRRVVGALKGGGMVYIALLGGINVGGHNVKMEHLRQLFAQLGFANVRSYIQTGNVFFETSEDDRGVL